MNRPLVSVIVPCYNAELYLIRCLDSIRNQTYTNLQIICVNDGSVDSSLQILQKYMIDDSRIIVINQENKGLSEARNAGLNVATGKYVSFIDSDDWIDLNYYEVLVDLLVRNNADIAMAGMRWVTKDRISKNKNKKCIEERFGRIIHNYPTGSVCDKLFRLDLFNENHLKFIKGRFYEDNIVLLQLSYFSKKVIFDNSVSYYYFYNLESITHVVSDEKEKKRERDMFFMVETIFNSFGGNNLSHKDEFELKRFMARTIAGGFFKTNSIFYEKNTHLFGKKYVLYYKLTTIFRREFWSNISFLRKLYLFVVKYIRK